MSAPTHGHAGVRSPTYKSWEAMWARCRREKHPAYARYGGRGITVCDRWRSFESFLADLGARPEGMTLERKDNAKGYEPENCVWATRKAQANNMTTNRLLTIAGVTRTFSQWAEIAGLSFCALRRRIDAGWDPLRAVTTAKRGAIIEPLFTPPERT